MQEMESLVPNKERQFTDSNKGNKKNKKNTKIFGLVLKEIWSVLWLLILAGSLVLAFKLYIYVDKIKVKAEKDISTATEDDFKLSVNSHVYDKDGNEMFLLRQDKNVEYLSYEQIPDNIKNAFVAVEDKRFYQHKGVDFQALVRVLAVYIKNHGVATQGGSTLTQQLIKLTYLSSEQTLERKIPEIFMALKFETMFSKEQILEYYINNVYFGNNAYGINAASMEYFDKPASELTLSQVAYLAAIPNTPTKYDPYLTGDNDVNEDTIDRRNLILKNMFEQGYISKDEYNNAISEEIKVVKTKSDTSFDSRRDYIIKEVVEIFMRQEGFNFKYEFINNTELQEYTAKYNDAFKANLKKIYREGYNIYTSFDETLQNKVQSDIDQSLAGNTETKEDGVFALQAASATVENSTGYIVAMVGGRTSSVTDYLNRASGTNRQNGSTMKPIAVYAPAMDILGYVPSTKIDNSNVGGIVNTSSYTGLMPIREAVQWSSNTVATRIFNELTPKVGLSYLTNMRFANIVPSDYVPAAALGGLTVGTNPKEMAGAYSCFANQGKYNKPTCIREIKNTAGDVVYEHTESNEQIYKPVTAIMMTDVLKTVAYYGTGAGSSFNNSIEVAGKTGTTNDTKDGWFVGYTPKYTTAVWTGYDTPREMYYTEDTKPVSIWRRIMESVHEGMSNLKFEEPEDLVKRVNIDYDGYEVPDGTPNSRWELFPKEFQIEKNTKIVYQNNYESLKSKIENNTNLARNNPNDDITISTCISNLKSYQSEINSSDLMDEDRKTLKSLSDYNMSILVDMKNNISKSNNNTKDNINKDDNIISDDNGVVIKKGNVIHETNDNNYNR